MPNGLSNFSGQPACKLRLPFMPGIRTDKIPAITSVGSQPDSCARYAKTGAYLIVTAGARSRKVMPGADLHACFQPDPPNRNRAPPRRTLSNALFLPLALPLPLRRSIIVGRTSIFFAFLAPGANESWKGFTWLVHRPSKQSWRPCMR